MTIDNRKVKVKWGKPVTTQVGRR